MTSTEIEMRPDEIAAAVGVPVGALAIRTDQTEMSPAQKRALAFIGLDKAPDGAVEAFLHLCQRTGLDPWAKQIYLIERGGTWTPQTGIDGFRIIAERREEYAGTTDILWCGEDGLFTDIWLGKNAKPYAARCSALRHDRADPITATALFAEFTAGNQKWNNSPAWMIGKCAEAGALRRAFPQDFKGLIIDEEAQALTAQTRRARVQSHRDGGPVEVGELTGRAASPAPEPPTSTPTEAPAQSADVKMVSRPQLGKLGALFTEAKVTDRDARLRVVASVVDRPLGSSTELTHAEAHQLITDLQQMGPDDIAALAGAPAPSSDGEQPQLGDEPVDAEVVEEQGEAGAEA